MRISCLVLTAILSLPASAADTRPPAVGDKAADFSLNGLDGKPVALADLRSKGPVVLVALRGYPGYQCPVCSAQVAGLLAKSEELAGASVVLVYPGPGAELEKRGKEFLGAKNLPSSFKFVLDPDYTFTNRYGLRWDAKNETAYPSTFVIDRDGAIRYAKVSMSHGGRAPVKEILDALGSVGKK